jgi:hypothetical protein
MMAILKSTHYESACFGDYADIDAAGFADLRTAHIWRWNDRLANNSFMEQSDISIIECILNFS